MESAVKRRGRRAAIGSIELEAVEQQLPVAAETPNEAPPSPVTVEAGSSHLQRQQQQQVNQRRTSYFTRRTSYFPTTAKSASSSPASLQLFSFYHQLQNTCQLKPAVECKFTCCGSNVEPSLTEAEQPQSGPGDIQLVPNAPGGCEGDIQELQFQLYMKEIQRINPSLRDGCLFVDGLYEFVASKLPAGLLETSLHKGSIRDQLVVHSSGVSLLHKYWHRPDDPAEHSTYLTVAVSFAEFVFSVFGSNGVAIFLRLLDDRSLEDPQHLTFKGKDIVGLELKWKKFVDAQVNVKFRLSSVGLMKELFTKHLARFWPHLFACLLIIFLDIGLNVSFSYGFGQLVSRGQTASDDDDGLWTRNETSTAGTSWSDVIPLLQWVAVILGSLLLQFVLVLISAALQTSMAVKVCVKLRKRLSLRLHHVNPKFFSDHSSSGVISTFTQDVNTVEGLIAHALRSVVFSLLLLVTYVVYALVMSWPLGIELVIGLALSVLLVQFLSVRFADHTFAKSQATNKLCSILKEEIDGYTVNRVYGLFLYWSSQMKTVLSRHYQPKARRSLFLTQFIVLFQVMVPNVVGTILTFSFILLVQLDWLSFDIGLSIFVFYSIVIMNIASASTSFPLLQSSTVALGRINAMLYDQNHSAMDHDDKTDDSLHGEGATDVSPLELNGVCFSYNPMASHWNLFDVSLKVRDGERVSVVGTSGSGKSTLLSLFLRIYKPVHGQVIVRDGVKIAAMFQFNHIFNMSIRENIRLSNLEASDTDVEEAAKMADLHVWVSSLPRGYDTVVNNSGSSLSGGQRQRVAIARMLLSKAQVLLLDEFTSALDPSTEARVFSQVIEVTNGKTVVAVTHRLNQAKEFDRIVVLSHGRIKEQGSHEELMAARGVYWHMWNNEDVNSPQGAVPIVRRRGSLASTDELTIGPMTPGCFGNEGAPPVINPPNTATPVFTPLRTLIEVHESLASDDDTTEKTPHKARVDSPTKMLQRSYTVSMEEDDLPIPLTTSTPSLKPRPQNSDDTKTWYENDGSEGGDKRSKFTLCAVSSTSQERSGCGQEERGCGHIDNTGSIYEHEL